MHPLDGFNINWDEPVWRYFNKQHFISLLETNKLYFAAASQFSDEFEGAVTIKPQSPSEHQPNKLSYYIDNAFYELKRLTKINCWHRAGYESDAMWRLYADEKKGIAINTTPERMRAAFKPFRLRPEYGVENLHAGTVKYIDLTKKFDKNIGMLHRFFYKHRPFEWEQEFRLAITLRAAEEFGVQVPDEGVFVDVDINVLIERIIIGPTTLPDDRDNIIDRINRAGLGKRVQPSTLSYKPRFI
jgi:hypothetical protein